ncbi:AMP-binding protein [Streptomyces himastatinicus ATCC 53653]|uniref:AMP-binding protein n=1 Tax=Streptomyces himastatinicus ATCC 53653 TaxID=457427 RepID=D9WFV3_9ACTN|nr:AMP-binding protein [Streptomyces himastatinicus ATCC 53653]
MILGTLARHGVTTLCAPPTLYRSLVVADLARYDLFRLRHCVSAGEPLNPEVIRMWEEGTRGLPVGLFADYWRDPDATAAAFANGWYFTGDKARRDEDGYFWFEGRQDDPDRAQIVTAVSCATGYGAPPVPEIRRYEARGGVIDDNC